MGFSSGLAMYISTIPYIFYAIVTVIIVFLFAMGWFPKLGPMKKAYERVQMTGRTYSEESSKYNLEPEDAGEEGSVIDFLLPVAFLIAATIIADDILAAVILTLALCLLLYVPRKRMTFTQWSGPQTYPLIIFLVVSALTFATSSTWGISTIVIPIIIPLGAAVGANMILTMAAILSGSTFGSHACFYSDATVLASAAARIENMEHAFSQIPYSVLGAAITCVCLLICGSIMI